jgi:hypothetical protein
MSDFRETNSALILEMLPIVISRAAESTSKIVRPLFQYWLMLPEHRDMVTTIFENLLRSYASSAREEFEGI